MGDYKTITAQANADLSALQNCFVEANASTGKITAPTGPTSIAIIGVLLNAPDTAGDACTIQVEGIAYVKGDGDDHIPFNEITADSSGKAGIAASTNAVLGYYYPADIEKSSAQTMAANDLVPVMLYDCKSIVKA